MELAVVAGPRGVRAPSDPLAARFLLASLVYLVAVVALVAAGAVALAWEQMGRLEAAGLFEVRDLVALFGWVGLMISGVSLIVVPNHFGVRVEPRWAARAHWWAANLGLGGLVASGLLVAAGAVPSSTMAPFLALVAGSFLLYAVVTVRALRNAFLSRALRPTNAPTEPESSERPATPYSAP